MKHVPIIACIYERKKRNNNKKKKSSQGEANRVQLLLARN